MRGSQNSDRVYSHYGYAPFWGTGYIPPGFPYRL